MNFACRFVAIMIVGLGIAALLTLASAGEGPIIVIQPSGCEADYRIHHGDTLRPWYCPVLPIPSRLWAERCVDTRPDLWTRVALAIPPPPRTDEWR
jgi:hypothetical protein